MYKNYDRLLTAGLYNFSKVQLKHSHNKLRFKSFYIKVVLYKRIATGCKNELQA